jgi:hypothetical protein
MRRNSKKEAKKNKKVSFGKERKSGAGLAPGLGLH